MTVSGDTHPLYDRRSKEEATLELPLSVSLLDFMSTLGIVLDECGPYSLFGVSVGRFWRSGHRLTIRKGKLLVSHLDP